MRERRNRERRRIHKNVKGAVTFVGDEADLAIEEAFRTKVTFNPLSVEAQDANSVEQPLDDDDDGDVWSVPEVKAEAQSEDEDRPADADQRSKARRTP